jgi:membrane associated rhomboid family serine protease
LLPIGDFNPRRFFPIATVGIVLANVLVFIYQLTLPEKALDAFVMTAGMIPAKVTHSFSAGAAASLVTSMFLHGGWMHIIGNMLYLWVFGDNVEGHLGSLAYLAFYIFAGVAAALAQISADPSSQVPTIGASGAVAGVLGAYAVLYPRNRVRVLLTLFYFIRVVQMPAIVVLGFWFILQLFNGLAAITASSSGGVAWFAHIGGFLVGALVGLATRGDRERGDRDRIDGERAWG